MGAGPRPAGQKSDFKKETGTRENSQLLNLQTHEKLPRAKKPRPPIKARRGEKAPPSPMYMRLTPASKTDPAKVEKKKPNVSA